MAKSVSLADAIRTGVLEESKRATWWTELSDSQREELSDVRRNFHAGEYGRAKRGTVARLLKSYCDKRGIKTCDTKRLSEWLRSKD